MLREHLSESLPKLPDCFRRFLIRRRVPITIVVATALIVEDVLHREQPHFIFSVRNPWSLAGLGLIFSGLFVRSWAAGILQKNLQLATSGPYALTRNPLYLGSFLMMFGFCTLIGDFDNFAIMAALILIVYLPGICNEQRRLLEQFGTSWQQYCQRTPMLLPRSLSVCCGGWTSGQWRKNKEHRAVLGTTIGLLAMAVWHQLAN